MDKHGNALVPESDINEFFQVPRKALCLETLNGIVAAGRKRKGAVLMVALEDFKAFNEAFGYTFAEHFLLKISKFLSGIPNADVYRITGVEFVVILEGLSRSTIHQAVEEISERFGRTWNLDGMDCMCAVNMGLCWFPGYGETADELVENLTHAVRDAAGLGQNRISVYNTDLMEKIERQSTIVKKTAKALQSGTVELRYRPTWNVAKSRYTRADSYIRMLDLETGIVPSIEFMHVAELTGQIGTVSRYAVEKTCELISEFTAEDKEFETIAVPISPIQFLQERFSQDVEEILGSYNIPPERLAIEVTDIMSMSAYISAQDNLNALSDMGVEIVLTEFGTGYSGLSSIMNMPVDVVKLDRMLIWQLDHDTKGPQVVEGLIHISKNLGIKLIAEGVETETQVALLRDFGCEYEQGFFYSPTLLPGELKAEFGAAGS